MLGQLRPSINLSHNDQPKRLQVIHQQFKKATVYYASERDYRTLWSEIGPKGADVNLNGAFVCPEHRLIVVRLTAREIPSDIFKRGCAKLSHLRQEEIHQSIRYGLNRLRGADEVRAKEGVFPRIRVERRTAVVPSGLLHGDPKSPFLMLSAGSVRVHLVDSDTWQRAERLASSSKSSASSKPFIIRQVTHPELHTTQLECVTTRTHLSELISHLISEKQLKNDRETAVSVWALSGYATDCSRIALTNALECRAATNGVDRQSVDLPFIAKNLVSMAELQNSKSPPAPEAQGRIWFNILSKLSPDALTDIDQTLAGARWILEIAKQRHPGLQCDPNQIKKLVCLQRDDRTVKPIPPELINRLEDRQPHEPPKRILIAQKNSLQQEAPAGSPSNRRTSLINHQRGRLEPGPAKDLFIEEIRANSLIPIDRTWPVTDKLQQPWQLPGATYLHVLFQCANFAIDLIDVGPMTALCEVRFHSRTRADLKELPSYRYSLRCQAPLHHTLELLGIKVVNAPQHGAEPCVYLSTTPGVGFVFWHPNFVPLGLTDVPVRDLGLYVSKCQQFVFGCSSYSGNRLIFTDRNGNELPTALPKTLAGLARSLSNQQKTKVAYQLAEYFKHICHDNYIPSNMNIALESLDIE